MDTVQQLRNTSAECTSDRIQLTFHLGICVWVFLFTVLLFSPLLPPFSCPYLTFPIITQLDTLPAEWLARLCFPCAFHNPPTAVSQQPHVCSLPQSSPVNLQEGVTNKKRCCTRQQHFQPKEDHFLNTYASSLKCLPFTKNSWASELLAAQEKSSRSFYIVWAGIVEV